MATVSPAGARKFSAEDVIVGLLALTENAAGGVRFPADTVRIHKGVATLRKDSRFSHLFGGLAFDTRDYFPYCDSLEGILDGLQLSGYLERTNPRGAHYLSLASLRVMFDSNIRQKFTDDELASLREASAKFFAMLRP